MKFWETQHTFDYPFSTCSTAMWRKYPNPLSPHIRSVDVLARRVDPGTGILSSIRLVTMQNALPGWLSKLFGINQDNACVYEQSEVDPRPESQRMTLRMRNVTFSDLLVVEETCTYMPHPEDPEKTLYKQECQISANFTHFAGKVEGAMLDKFVGASKKGKEALEVVCQMIHKESEELSMLLLGTPHAVNSDETLTS